MPTYEFRCANGHEFQRFYKTMSSADMELPCPECSATAFRQLSGGAGLLFKGSGFYLTDYGKNAHRGTEPKGGTSESGKSEGGKSESGKSESAKTDGGKSDSGKSTGGKSSSEPAPKSSTEPKAAKPAPKPKAE